MMTGVVDAPVNGGASDQNNAGSSSGTESDASGSSQGETNDASGSQDSAEGGSAAGQGFRQRGPSKLDTIRELRSKLRDRDQRYSSEIETLRSQIEEMKSMFSPRNQEQKPRRTFWEAPDEVTREITREEMAALKEDILNEWRQSRQMDQQSSEWKQETSEAAKFIREQKVTVEDETEIAEIIRETPAMRNMRPMDAARYALYLWKEEKGINQDKSGLKARAAPVKGAAPAAGGQRIWTESEMEAEMAKFPSNPKDWTDEQKKQFDALNREFSAAYKQNRVKTQK